MMYSMNKWYIVSNTVFVSWQCRGFILQCGAHDIGDKVVSFEGLGAFCMDDFGW